jgi:hypothetical protein
MVVTERVSYSRQQQNNYYKVFLNFLLQCDAHISSDVSRLSYDSTAEPSCEHDMSDVQSKFLSLSYPCNRPSMLPYFLDNQITDGGEVVSLTHRPPFTPQEDSRYSFLLEAESTPGP